MARFEAEFSPSCECYAVRVATDAEPFADGMILAAARILAAALSDALVDKPRVFVLDTITGRAVECYAHGRAARVWHD